MRICVWVFHTVGAVHEPARGIARMGVHRGERPGARRPIVTAIWINHRGDERNRATRGEITNNHEMPLRDDLDDKALRTLDAIESLRGAVDGLRDDMNGEFATVNRRITTTEQNLIELRHEVNDLRRGGNHHQ